MTIPHTVRFFLHSFVTSNPESSILDKKNYRRYVKSCNGKLHNNMTVK